VYRILVGESEWKRPLKDLCVGGRIILKCLREIGFGDADWIHLAHDKVQGRALVNIVMNLLVS
jgi:hypothetical protein